MSIYDRIRKGLNSEEYATVTPSFQPAIYIFKKEDIELKFDETDPQIVIDLKPIANIQWIKIRGRFEAESKQVQTKVGSKYLETVSIHTPSMSASMQVEFKYQLTILGNFRLCVITIKEGSEVELYGATVGLTVGYHGENIVFETINGSKESWWPKVISITAADGSRSIAATGAEIERLASL